MTEADAIRLAQAGDQDAFAVLYKLHHPTVLKHCASILRSQDAAEDASQEVFLQLFRRISSYRGESKFSVWLCSMTRNACFTLLRESKRELPRAADLELPESVVQKTDAQTAALNNIPCRRVNALTRAALKESFDRLPAESQAAYTANIVHGHTIAQVCRSTGTSRGMFYRHRRHAERVLQQAAVSR